MGTDSVSYHQIALDRYKLIKQSGWGNWVLSPLGQTPAGIASFFYVLITPKPWVMMPFLAAFQAGSGCLLLKILSLFENKAQRWVRLVAVIPFLVFPSAVIIYGQLLKDGYFIFGNLLFIYGWLRWLKKRHNQEMVSFWEYVLCLLLFVLAYLSVWIVRPYWGPIFFLWSLTFFILITFNQGWRLFTGGRTSEALFNLLDIVFIYSFGLWFGHSAKKTSLLDDHRGPRP